MIALIIIGVAFYYISGIIVLGWILYILNSKVTLGNLFFPIFPCAIIWPIILLLETGELLEKFNIKEIILFERKIK